MNKPSADEITKAQCLEYLAKVTETGDASTPQGVAEMLARLRGGYG